jgi:hypothetical protein
VDAPPVDYCREIETYLCRKNGGHLIRIVGPSFELVSSWAERGIPLKVAFEGIDRTIDRQARKSGRRRPLKIDFCEADVLDVFDEWRRAVGLPAPAAEVAQGPESAGTRPALSLAAHLERVLARLTQARVSGALGSSADALIDRVARDFDLARSAPRGLRGEARQAVVERLTALDAELLREARAALRPETLAELEAEADQGLSAYRARMAPEAFAAARDAAFKRLLRVHADLPQLVFQG